MQIVLAVLLVGAILLQQTSASAGGAFGGGDSLGGYHTRRGAEKMLFNMTIYYHLKYYGVKKKHLVMR